MSRPTRFVGRDPHERAAAAAASGHAGTAGPDELRELVRMTTDDPDARVRAAALGAVIRGAGRDRARRVWCAAAADADEAVRRRAAELAPDVAAPMRTLLSLVADPDWSVAEAAAWALGELEWSPTNRRRAVGALVTLVGHHDDPLVREAAVAALGAIGDPAGLPAVLTATSDRRAVRRRAVLALAPFDGPEVDDALDTALTDPDWQVRQAAEDLVGEGAERADTTTRDENR